MTVKLLIPFITALCLAIPLQAMEGQEKLSSEPEITDEFVIIPSTVDAEYEAQQIHDKIFEKEDTIGSRVTVLEQEIKKILSSNTPVDLQKILSHLIHLLVNNIGGSSHGAKAWVMGKVSDHLILAHYVNDFMNHVGLTLDKGCMTWITIYNYYIPGTKEVTCSYYLMKNPITEKHQEKMGILVAEYKAHFETQPRRELEKKGVKKTLSEEEIDNNYHQFVKKYFEGLEYYNDTLVDPVEYIKSLYKHYKLITPLSKISFPPGQYAKIQGYGSPWTENMFGTYIEKYNNLGQGWKIHVTAMPHSAQKIAELILPHIDDFNHLYGIDKTDLKKTGMKIITSIPLMRSTWYILNHINGKETQSGKFLVIYPANTNHAYDLVKKIDEILNNAKREGILTSQDFLPLSGDAKVGSSGGVYVRYGGFTKKTVDVIDQSNQKISFSEVDDRFYPWPDFMNKHNPDWRQAPNPFKDLPLQWAPKPGMEPLTWETRPQSWNELEEKIADTAKEELAS